MKPEDKLLSRQLWPDLPLDKMLPDHSMLTIPRDTAPMEAAWLQRQLEALTAAPGLH